MKTYIYLITISFLFSSCKDAVSEPFGNNYYFETPQPINDSELTSIPNKFLGLYMNSDSTYLNIKENIILQETYSRFIISKKELDSLKNDFEIINGKYILKSTKQIYDYRILKDSIQFTNKDIDTFFIFSNTQKAKRIDGQLVINERDSIFWKVKLISLDKKNLKITEIYSEDDLKKMDSITKNKAVIIDSSSFIIKPTRPEFKKFLSLEKFGDQQYFKKIKKW